MLGEHAEALRLLAGDVDEEIVCGDDVRDVECFVGETGERPLGERDQADRHVDPDHRHGRVHTVLDRVQVPADVFSLTDPVDHRRHPDREIGSDRSPLARTPVLALVSHACLLR